MNPIKLAMSIILKLNIMRRYSVRLWLLALLSVVILPGTASAHHARVGVGVYFGPGYYYSPYYYPPPVYYPPQPVVIQQQAPVYIEQAPSSVAQQASGDWFYCPASKTYYPYVKDCTEPWQRVAPVPPSVPGR